MKISSKKSINFNDVNLLSIKPTIIKSRDEIAFNNNRIIAAPMSAIMGHSFVKKAAQLGISLPIHRFCTVEEQQELLQIAIENKALFKTKSLLWLCVGLHDYKRRIEKNIDVLKENNVGILLDVANGFHLEVKDCMQELKKYECNNIFTGNIHTLSGWKFLEDIGSDFIRAGIGNGAACSTTNNTGIGRGQITIVDEIYNDGVFRSAELVSDGGIKESGDAAKSFAAGADYVMIGSMFSYANEAACNDTGHGIFYGGASKTAKNLMHQKTKNIEGKELSIDQTKLKSLEEIVQELSDGIKSSISYCGFSCIESFIGQGVFEIKL